MTNPDPMPWATLLLAMWPLWFALLVLLVLGLVDLLPWRRPPRCGHTIGPVPKLEDAVFVCSRTAGHPGDHGDDSGTWWTA